MGLPIVPAGELRPTAKRPALRRSEGEPPRAISRRMSAVGGSFGTRAITSTGPMRETTRKTHSSPRKTCAPSHDGHRTVTAEDDSELQPVGRDASSDASPACLTPALRSLSEPRWRNGTALSAQPSARLLGHCYTAVTEGSQRSRSRRRGRPGRHARNAVDVQRRPAGHPPPRWNRRNREGRNPAETDQTVTASFRRTSAGADETRLASP